MKRKILNAELGEQRGQTNIYDNEWMKLSCNNTCLMRCTTRSDKYIDKDY